MVLFLVLGTVGAWRIAKVLPERSRGVDFSHYYASSRILLDGGDPYASDLEVEVGRLGMDLEGLVERATNPPPLVALLAPLAALPPEAAYVAWTAIQVFFLAVFLWLVVAIAGLSGRGAVYLVGAALFSLSVYTHFYYAQTQLLLGVLLLLALRWLRAAHPLGATALVTSAGLLKLFPFLLLPWFVWRAGRWRTRWAAAGIAAGLIGAAVALQWPLWLSFARHAPPSIAAGVRGLPFNFSLPSILIRLGVAELPSVLVGLLALAVGYGACARSGSGKLVEQFALLTCVVVAGTATAWGHYHVLLLFPFALLARELSAAPTPARLAAIWGVYMTAIFLAHLPGVHGGPRVLLAALPLYGNLGMAGYWVWRLSSSSTLGEGAAVSPGSAV